MSQEGWGLVLTFVLACASAAVFLTVRCEGKGRVFGPRSRRWALAAVGLTGAVSTLGAWGLAALGHYLPGVIVGLGVAAPSALCLERIRQGMADRPGVLGSAVTLGLGRLLDRLDYAMIEDRDEWCGYLVDPDWDANTMLMANDEYYDLLRRPLSDEDCARYRIAETYGDIVTRLMLVKQIDALPPGPSESEQDLVFKAFAASALAGQTRYTKYFDDLDVLGRRLRHDARQDMGRLLAVAYCARFGHLRRYEPPARLPARAD